LARVALQQCRANKRGGDDNDGRYRGTAHCHPPPASMPSQYRLEVTYAGLIKRDAQRTRVAVQARHNFGSASSHCGIVAMGAERNRQSAIVTAPAAACMPTACACYPATRKISKAHETDL
jgi:hypothetical protein